MLIGQCLCKQQLCDNKHEARSSLCESVGNIYAYIKHAIKTARKNLNRENKSSPITWRNMVFSYKFDME